MSLPNWSTNPHLRRVLQRMQADYTSIFGGRDRELAALDGWLADDSRPYALLLAPTGRGKTALVWHWLLRQQHEWQVIFVPVSIRYGNSSQADVFAALTHAFAHMHGELAEFNALQHSANELRPKLAAYLRRDLPADTRVLLAIDGLDEATGWELGADLLPENPPANLKIMLSARDMAQHQRVDWYRKLGLHADRTQDFTLGGLDRIALKELLIALGTPLDELAADFDILGEFLRVSAGDPVIVRLLVQLLREDRIQIGQLTQLPQDDLNAVFALWLNQLSAKESQIAQILLLLFANAYGPLSARDLLGLAPDHFADAEQIAHAITPLARFVIGDAESGYVFSHQKLRELYRDRLDAQTLAEWNARFVNYGKQAHQDPTPYLCRFLVNHLRDAGEWQFIRHLLADFSPQQAWAESHYALESSYGGYLRDLEVLQDWAIEQKDLALYSHCSLISSSIISMSSNLAGELLVQLIKVGTTKGKWSVETALAHIEQQPSNAVEKLEALIAADIPLPWELTLDIIDQAEDDQPLGYMAIYPFVPEQFHKLILDKLAASFHGANPFHYLEKLIQFIPNIPLKRQDILWQHLVELNYNEMRIFPILHNIPEHWKPQLLVKQKNYLEHTFRKIIPQQIGNWEHTTIIKNFRLLPSEQQSLAYWGISFEDAFTANLDIVSLLPEQEIRGLVEYIYRFNLTEYIKQNSFFNMAPSILENILFLYQHVTPQEPKLLQKVLDALYKYPEYLDKTIAKLLPVHTHYALVQQILSKPSFLLKDFHFHTRLLLFLETVPQLRSQLIKLIITVTNKLDFQLQASKYCVLVPYLDSSQQPKMVERAWHVSRLINSTSEEIKLQFYLLDYLSPQDQVDVSQGLFQTIRKQASYHKQDYPLYRLAHKYTQLRDSIYQYVITTPKLIPLSGRLLHLLEQEQSRFLATKMLEYFLQKPYQNSLSGYILPYLTQTQLHQLLKLAIQNKQEHFSHTVFHNLIGMPNYPHEGLLKYIQEINFPMYEFTFLSDLFTETPQDQQEPIKKVINQLLDKMVERDRLSVVIYHVNNIKNINSVLCDHFLQDIGHHISHYQRLRVEFSLDQQQKISEGLWAYIRSHAWSLDAIIENEFVYKYCVRYFDHQQKQAVLEYIASKKYNSVTVAELIPYLNQDQLEHLHLLIQKSAIDVRMAYYLTAHKHHNFLQQEYYYQILLNWLNQEQYNHKDWDWLDLLNIIAPCLQSVDYKSLLDTLLNRLSSKYPSSPKFPNTNRSHYVDHSIEQIVAKNLLSQTMIQQFISYAAFQDRSIYLMILNVMLPPHLETLAPEQAQQLASQINQSIEQISTCWP
jgi:hypothetical protein